MNTRADKNQEIQSRAVDNSVSKKENASNSTFQFVDNLAEAIAQRKLQEIASNSPKAKKTAQLQAMDDNSPRIVAQRQQMERIFGGAIQQNGNLEEKETLQGKSESVAEKAVAQLRPDDWNCEQITSITSLPHGWLFSTWKQIKAQINAYRGLPEEPFVKRRANLDRMERLIAEWKANPKHPRNSRNQRVRDIYDQLPTLEDFIQSEYLEMAEADPGGAYAHKITREMGIEHRNIRYAISGVELPEDQKSQACYNFAVGSFNAINGIKHLQAAIPSYIHIRSGGLSDKVMSPNGTLKLMDKQFAEAITPEIINSVEEVMKNAGVNLEIGTQVAGGATAAQRGSMWLPLQELILRLSGLHPDPGGQWAVGFRGTVDNLGSDHAWIEAYHPIHPGYISFDTFPKAHLRVSRNRHSDPIVVPDGQMENRIKITSPTTAQMDLINQALAAPEREAGRGDLR